MNGASNPAGSGTGSTRLATKVDQATQTPENIGRETRNFTLKALKLQLNVTPNTLNLRFEFLFSLSLITSLARLKHVLHVLQPVHGRIIYSQKRTQSIHLAVRPLSFVYSEINYSTRLDIAILGLSSMFVAIH